MTITFGMMVLKFNLKVNSAHVPDIIIAGADNLYPFN
jgi:hypothetical protein